MVRNSLQRVKKVPLAQWLSEGLQDIKDRLPQEMPGVKLKIDMIKELAYWQAIAKENKQK